MDEWMKRVERGEREKGKKEERKEKPVNEW